MECHVLLPQTECVMCVCGVWTVKGSGVGAGGGCNETRTDPVVQYPVSFRFVGSVQNLAEQQRTVQG